MLQGNCYRAAYDLAAREADIGISKKVELVHGSVILKTGDTAGKSIPHAWVEIDDVVYDHSNEFKNEFDKAFFYKNSSAEVYARYLPAEATLQNLKATSYGPWDELSLSMETNK
ncbi:MAG: hypothetical protein SH868_16910 [Bythopirellula sp.]|nr:hypothetical protein [Bythopirellula sp.]